MDIKAILSKIGNGEEISDEERKSVKTEPLYTQDELEEEANARAAKARKVGEGNKSKMESQIEDLESEIEEAKKTSKSKKNKDNDEEIEKIKTDYQKKIENLQTELETERAERAKQQRSQKLRSLRGQVGFIEKDSEGNQLLAEETVGAILDQSFAEVDTEDLDRKAVIDPIVRGIREKNPHLIQDNSGAPGSGHQKGSSLNAQSQAGEDVSMSERQKQLRNA